jgi:hypothetical protein
MLRVTKSARAQRGYALMMVLFISAVMIIMAAAAMPNLLTQGRRQREDEMIWRGGQYERAVRLYYHKYGRFPQKIDDLVKGNNGLRFLRQAYPDPTNKADGNWRLIYVTPAGILIGSVRYKSLAELNAAQHPGTPNPFGSVPGNAPGTASAFGGFGPQGMQPGGLSPQSGMDQGMTQSQNPGGLSQSANPQNPNPSGFSSSPGSPIEPSDLSGGSVIGGNIIGVGGTAKKASLKVFEGGKTYRDWEFIWNPLSEAMISNQTGAVPGQPVAGPQGALPGNNPTPMPTPQPPQNPPSPPPQQ